MSTAILVVFTYLHLANVSGIQLTHTMYSQDAHELDIYGPLLHSSRIQRGASSARSVLNRGENVLNGTPEEMDSVTHLAGYISSYNAIGTNDMGQHHA